MDATPVRRFEFESCRRPSADSDTDPQCHRTCGCALARAGVVVGSGTTRSCGSGCPSANTSRVAFDLSDTIRVKVSKCVANCSVIDLNGTSHCRIARSDGDVEPDHRNLRDHAFLRRRTRIHAIHASDNVWRRCHHVFDRVAKHVRMSPACRPHSCRGSERLLHRDRDCSGVGQVHGCLNVGDLQHQQLHRSESCSGYVSASLLTRAAVRA